MKKPMFNFRNKRRVVRVVLSHVTILLAVLTLTCFIIDRFNTAMEFMTSDVSKWLFAALAATSLAGSILNIVALWVNPDRKRKK